MPESYLGTNIVDSAPVTNTVVPTVLPAPAQFTIPAFNFSTNGVFRIRQTMVYSANAGETLQPLLRFGGQVIAGYNFTVNPSGAVNNRLYFDLEIVIRGPVISTSVLGITGVSFFELGGNGSIVQTGVEGGTTITLDLTQPQTFDTQITWGHASSGNTVRLTQWVIEQVK